LIFCPWLVREIVPHRPGTIGDDVSALNGGRLFAGLAMAAVGLRRPPAS
jgi:hypothetical protein